jgi:poly-beta-1,6-N-acetyl-D-glucosamine biosynthesis protein PgaD
MKIIDGRQKKKVKVFELLFTSFSWVILIGFFGQVILSILIWVFNLSNIYVELILLGNIEDSISIMLTTIIISLCSFIMMYVWGRYNYKKYGKLQRRTFPKDVTAEDLSEYFLLSKEEVERFQSDKIIKLEDNIIL